MFHTFAWTDVPGQLGEEIPSHSAHASTDHRFTGVSDNTDIHQIHWCKFMLATFCLGMPARLEIH